MAILLIIRTIIKPGKGQIKLDKPKEDIGMEIEITYFPLIQGKNFNPGL